jgi:hypothetical protein
MVEGTEVKRPLPHEQVKRGATAMGDTKAMSKSREAWSELGDEFADIARRFRENYQSLSGTAEAGSEKSRKSIERSVRTIRKTLGELGDSLTETMRDPKFREETADAGSALLNAFGVTLTELGEALQRDAEDATTDSDRPLRS